VAVGVEGAGKTGRENARDLLSQRCAPAGLGYSVVSPCGLMRQTMSDVISILARCSRSYGRMASGMMPVGLFVRLPCSPAQSDGNQPIIEGWQP
jgi:hypothetical protein